MENIEPLIFSGAAGAIAGFLVGYAIKKLAKIVAIFLGIILLVILFLASQGIIYINLKSLENILLQTSTALNWIVTAASKISDTGKLVFGTGFLGGTALGFKKG